MLNRSKYLHWLLLSSFYKLKMVGANGWYDSYQDKFGGQTNNYQIRLFQRNHLHTLSFRWYLPNDLPEMLFSVHTFLCVPGQNDVIHKNLDPFHNMLMCSSLSGFKFHMACHILRYNDRMNLNRYSQQRAKPVMVNNCFKIDSMSIELLHIKTPNGWKIENVCWFYMSL